MRRRWLLYSLLAVNVIVNAVLPPVFLLSALLLVVMSFRAEYRPLFRLYGVVILVGGLLALFGGFAVRSHLHF
jgi:hypothetical protein